VVCCSVGGSCALEIARPAPDLVLGVVLVGVKAGVHPDLEQRDEAVRLLTERGMEAAWEPYWRPLFGGDTPADTPTEARQVALEWRCC
jgi:hypothetical protein